MLAKNRAVKDAVATLWPSFVTPIRPSDFLFGTTLSSFGFHII